MSKARIRMSISLQKEINSDIDDLKKLLMDKRSYFSELPLTESEVGQWENVIQSQETRLIDINKKIDKYNLLVPILKQQMCRVQMDKISEKVLSCKPNAKNRVPNKVKSSERQESGLLSSIFWWT